VASLDFELEKTSFRKFYGDNVRVLEDAKNSFMTLIRALVAQDGKVVISKVEGRVKDLDECIEKFNNKYRTGLESSQTAYSISDHISDLIGLRVVCLYEDEVEKVRAIVSRHLQVIEVTDKTASLASTEGDFGYKGLHLDVCLNDARRVLPEHEAHAAFRFELQIRTIIQDSWSVLDHKIKYKRSIPNELKRRINTLAALFDLADREFLQIRDATNQELAQAEGAVYDDAPEAAEVVVVGVEEVPGREPGRPYLARTGSSVLLNAFSFLRIAKHFFRNDEFDPVKVDRFTGAVLGLEPGMTRAKFNDYLFLNLPRVKRYQVDFEAASGRSMNPLTLIRHALFLADRALFGTLLTNAARDNFEQWLREDDAGADRTLAAAGGR
jgi:ppGpp synthetase/RelA/SpoT-type nucleotidyltranferase